MSESKGAKDQSAQAMQSMQEVLESMIRFSSAMAMFGVQQLKNGAEMAMDPQHSPTKFRENLDKITKNIRDTLDSDKRATSDKLSDAGEELVSSMRMPALDPGEVAHTMIEAFRNAMDSMTDLVKKTASSVAEAAKDTADGVTAGSAGGEKAGEPKAA
jgi:methyl-accepting chemotaxis protein